MGETDPDDVFGHTPTDTRPSPWMAGRGELAGTRSAESAERRAANHRIAELEADLATVKRASELLDRGWCAPSTSSGSGDLGQ